MRLMSGLALVVLALVLSGCPVRQSPTGAEAQPYFDDSPAAIVVASASLARVGRTEQALSMVKEARQRHPQSGALAAQQTRLEMPADPALQRFEDQLLLDEVRHAQGRVDHVLTWLEGHPDDTVARAKLTHWSRQLSDRVEGLTGCAERHVEERPKLARACLTAAKPMPGSGPYATRLAAVEKQLAAKRQVVRQRREAAKVKKESDLVAELLQSARLLLAGGSFRAANDLLQQAAKMASDDPEVTDLMLEAELGLDRQIESLLVLGDRLYLDEQIDAALANWEEALSLRPGDEEIIARIDRARTVLDRLESLREQQLAR